MILTKEAQSLAGAGAFTSRVTGHPFSSHPVFLIAIIGAAVIGLFVLLGWILDIPALRSVIPGAVEMKANTAVGLILSAAALFALSPHQPRTLRRAGGLMAAMVAALGAIALGEYAFNWNAGIDELLFRDTGNAFNAIRGRMSPFSAVSFLAIGIAIASTPNRKLLPATIVGGLFVLAIGAASFIGYIWDAQELTTDSWVPPVAVNTAVAFILLGAAAMLAVRMAPGYEARSFTPVERRVLIGFVLALVLLLGIGWYAYWVQAQALASAQRLVRTQEVRGSISALYDSVFEAQSAQRNYLLTHRPIYKLSFAQRLEKIETRLKDLAPLVKDDPAQFRNYEKLRRLIHSRTTLLSHHLNLFELSSLDDVREAIGRDGGLDIMEAIRLLVGEMDDIEVKALAGLEFELARTRQLTLVALLGLLGITTTIVLLLFMGIRRENTKRIRADEGAQKAIAAKESFLATMSHEIRTPVNGLLGMLELLALTGLDPRQRELLSAARDSGSGLVRIVDDVLDHAKISAGKLEICPEPTSIHALARRVVRTHLAVASAKDLVLTESVDATISPCLLADAHRIDQILGNFISNAIKFTSAGSVELRIERIAGDAERETIRFSVCDTGIGIDLPAQQRLFQPFEQAATDTSRAYGGTGLGLAISRRLAELMGGTIEMNSAPGEGTTMSLTLTLTPCDPLSDLPDELAPTLPRYATAEGNTATVLAVDDHPTNRHLLSSQLTALGIRTVTVSSGLEALERWRSGGIDLVITDCNMPGMDGYSLSRAIREEEQGSGDRVPIVAWTASVLEGSVGRCREAGMDEMLEKPSDIAQLRRVLSQWLSVSAARQEPLLDPAAMAGFVRDDDERAEILAEFVSQMASDLSAFDLVLAAGDLTECGQIAHRMKGAARLLGARDLAAMSEAIERATSQDVQQVKALRPALDTALVQLTHYADAYTTGDRPDADRIQS